MIWNEAIVWYYCGIVLEIVGQTGNVQLGQPVMELKFELRTSKTRNITDINLSVKFGVHRLKNEKHHILGKGKKKKCLCNRGGNFEQKLEHDTTFPLGTRLRTDSNF
jgi:hypothetical protein